MLTANLGRAGFVLKKSYFPGALCLPLDVVSHNGSLWACLEQTREEPDANSPVWMHLLDGGVARILLAEAPLRIDGGDSADLSQDRTLSIDLGKLMGTTHIVHTITATPADGVWAAPWPEDEWRWVDITVVGAGGAGGSSGQGGGPTYAGYGGYNGGNTTFDNVMAEGGGGGAGGAHGGGGGGGGAGVVQRVRRYIQGGAAFAVTIGAGGGPGANAHAATYDQSRGKGTYGGRPLGSATVWANTWLGNVEGGGGGGLGESGMSAQGGQARGGYGARNGTGYGGGGGGGSYSVSSWQDTAGGGRAYDGGQYGHGPEPYNTANHALGGRGGNGAIIIEWNQDEEDA